MKLFLMAATAAALAGCSSTDESDLSADARLSNLAVSGGTLSPAFSSTTYVYAVQVPNATTTATVTPTVEQAGATVKVNTVTVATGAASAPIDLTVGANVVTVTVTAENGDVLPYTVTITRATAGGGSPPQ